MKTKIRVLSLLKTKAFAPKLKVAGFEHRQYGNLRLAKGLIWNVLNVYK